MPNILTRLRSLRGSKATSTPTAKSIETDVALHVHDERECDAQAPQDASVPPDSPSHNAELDSKVYPDLSALFASVEDALRTAERVVKVKKRGRFFDETASDAEDDAKRAARARTRRNNFDGTIYASYGSSLRTGWSTFGQEDTPCPSAPRRAHIASYHHNTDRANRAVTANFRRPSSADAVLSWSPEQVIETSESSRSLRPSSFSRSPSPALFSPSPGVQHENNPRQSSYYTTSPGTFGYPSPPNFMVTNSPSFPPPAFHSTPRRFSSRSYLTRRRGPKTSSRHRTPTVGPLPSPPLPPETDTMTRTGSGHIKSTKSDASVSVESSQNPKCRSSSVSRAVNRRKSAEWNAHAASAGVVADPNQTTEFGWPAEVSREILRLSLGQGLKLHGQNKPIQLQPESASSKKWRDLKRGLPRVSHDYKLNARIIRPTVSEECPSSAPLYFTTLLPSSSTSSAPGRSDRPQTTATQPESTPRAPGVAARKTVDQFSGDHALDAKLEENSNMGAAGVAEHKRFPENDNRIDWESAELQEFISREEGSSGTGDAHVLQTSTPMKKSESSSTYQTAGSSSYLQAPSLSVIAPTPRSTPGNSRHSSGALPDTPDGLHVPTAPQTGKSKGKRKAEETDGSPPDLQGSRGNKMNLVTEVPHRDSNDSRAPSSFHSLQSQKSRKRVRLSSPTSAPNHSQARSAVPHHLESSSSRGSSRSNLTPAHFPPPDSKGSFPRPSSRMSRTSRAVSAALSGGSSVAFPHRRSLSQASIPISAIVTPRAPSVSHASTYHMRDPRRPPPVREVGWTLRFSSFDDDGSPFVAWAFWLGFLFPLLWWVASFWRLPKTRMVGTDTEKAVIVDDPFYEREAGVWRLRCRVASVLFFFTYVPVIVLLAIFA